jgi:hypothetical protein
MYVNLDEGCIADAAEAVDLPGLNDKNVTGAGFEFLPVDGPETPAFPHELDFIVGMTMGPGTVPGKGAEEEDGDIDVPVLGSNEAVRAALKWQVLLPTRYIPPIPYRLAQNARRRSLKPAASPQNAACDVFAIN